MAETQPSKGGIKLERLPVASLAGPRGVPLLGPMGSMMRFFRDPVGALLKLHKSYGEVSALARGDAALVCAFGAKHNQAILSDAKRFENFAEVPIPVPPDSVPARLLKNALTSLNGERHRSRRRMVMPMFAKAAVERYRDAMVLEIEQRLARFQPGAELDVEREMTQLTLAIAVRCLFGLEEANGGVELGQLAVEYLERLIDPLAMMFPFGIPGTPYRRFFDVSKELEARVLALIEERRKASDKVDVLSLLIRAHDDDGSTMSDEELVAQVTVFFVAGFETTANTLAWTMFLLSQHPDAYATVAAELDRVLGGRIPEVADLPALTELDRVVKESMRILPATPFLFMRRGTEPFTLGAHSLPAGSIVFLSSLVTHRDPTVFADPQRFSPQRWTSIDPGPYQYLPFGAGPRLCIGASFASQAIRLVLATLLARVRPVLADGARIDRKVRGIVLGMKRGMPMRFVAPNADGSIGNVRGDIHELVDLR